MAFWGMGGGEVTRPAPPWINTESTLPTSVWHGGKFPVKSTQTCTLSQHQKSNVQHRLLAFLFFPLPLHWTPRLHQDSQLAGFAAIEEVRINFKKKVRPGYHSHVWTKHICQPVSQTPVFGCCSSRGESQTYRSRQGHFSR